MTTSMNAQQLYNGFVAGAISVIQHKQLLNKMNVYPVPDGDTGTNLALTLKEIVDCSTPGATVQDTFRSIANAALQGARGNSGTIIAQYFYGLAKESETETEMTTQ
ncbi:MAG: DAK2 domain-containing protein, partial [Bacilli bacterium]